MHHQALGPERRIASLRTTPGYRTPSSGKNRNAQSRLVNLFTGKNLIITTLVTAIIGFAVPRGFVILEEHLSPPVQVSASLALSSEIIAVLPQALSADEVSALVLETADSVLRDKGAVSAGNQQVILVVRGNSSNAVTITNIHARVLDVRPAINGTLVYSPYEGRESIIRVGAELGAGDHSVQDIADDGVFAGRHFAETVYTLKKDEIVIFNIQAHATNGTYAWDVGVDFVVDGDLRTFYAGSKDQPFRVSSLSSTYGTVVTMGDGTLTDNDGSMASDLTAVPVDQFCLPQEPMCKDSPQ